MVDVKKTIITTLKAYDFIDASFIFGSFGTNEFMDHSDIDIAILVNKNIDFMTLLEIEELLENKLKIKVDLNLLEELPEHIQLKIIIRNYCLFIRNSNNYDKYLDKLNHWYKTEFPFWVKLMTERGST